MVTTTNDYSNARYSVGVGHGLDGVVRVSVGGYYASGSLLYDGRAVLTAAHLFSGRTGAASVAFTTASGTQTLSTNQVVQHPSYDFNSNNDLAIVWLATSAPTVAERYNLYRATDAVGQQFAMVGYGQVGVGATGAAANTASAYAKLTAANSFDIDGAALKAQLGGDMGWNPLAGTQLLADFDNGSAANDALGVLANKPHLGLGVQEGLIAQGDSGGPAFIDGKVAGVGSYTASLSAGEVRVDVDALSNSSFGEVAAWQNVSAYAQWIDQTMRAHYVNAPTRAQDVQTSVTEGNSANNYTYFMVEFSGTRSSPDAVVSVDYATRDGTATQGTDYLAVSGTLQLYPNERQAVIPVEVVGDYRPEASEFFYLDVFNPVGGSFGLGISKMTATRTIVANDGWVA